jgi:S-DNA-T family DNA segregation ATPase FtsK/SpoIIIE
LLAYKRAGRDRAWTVGLRGDHRFPGRLFHDRIAQPFHHKLASAQGKRLKQALAGILTGGGPLEAGLHGLLQAQVLDPFFVRHGPALDADQIMALARAVELWNRHLAAFLAGHDWSRETDPAGRLGEFFRPPEERIQYPFDLGGGQTIRISGAYDMLLVDPRESEAVLLEFKGYRPRHEDEDFIQVALYGWLIHQATGIRPRAVVFYLEEDPPEAPYSADELTSARPNLEALIRAAAQLIGNKRNPSPLPLPPDGRLCAECPFDPDCDRDWGSRGRPATHRAPSVEAGIPPKAAELEPLPPASAPQEKPQKTTDRASVSEAGQFMERLVASLKQLKLYVEPDGYLAGPRLIRLRVKPMLEKGATFRKIANHAEDLQVVLDLRAAPLIQAQAGHVSVDVPRRVTTPLTLGELMERMAPGGAASPVVFPLGLDVAGAVILADLANPTMTSILVAGTSGSGKSVFLRAVVISLAMNARPDRIQFTLIDPKRVSFLDMETLPHLASPLILDVESALTALSGLVDDMERRYELMQKKRVQDLGSWPDETPPFPHHLVVIDEYADLMSDKESKKLLEHFVQRLAQKGRAAGYHLLLATQRPERTVVTPLIKANLQLKVALKVTSGANSKLILDEEGAQRLLGNGDMLVGGAVPLERLQGALPTRTEIEAALVNR